MSSRVTRIEYNHGTKVFMIVEKIDGQDCHYQTKDIWQVIQRLQNLIIEAKEGRHDRS